MDDFMGLAMRSQAEVQVEVFGILSNLAQSKLDFMKLAKKFDLLRYFTSILAPAAVASPEGNRGYSSGEDLGNSDDLLLEVIVLLGSISSDEEFCKAVATTKILSLLVEITTGTFYFLNANTC
jgi:hypothetical protein